jgi:transcriptional regulator with XRE-family HTH domain
LAEGEVPVRVWREYRGFSLRGLAEKAGISAAMLSEIETGKKDGSVRTLAALARVFGLDLDDLVSWN